MDQVAKLAIYSPPLPGLPYLLVTMSEGEISAVMPIKSRDEARRVMLGRDIERQAIKLVTSTDGAKRTT